MASTLMLIKSKAMLPTEEVDLEEEIDQQSELIQHLLEYKKYKVLSRGLKDRAAHRRELVNRPHQSIKGPTDGDIDFEEVSLWDIIKAFARVVKETGLDRNVDVIHSEKPITAYISGILERILVVDRLDFEGLFEGEITRSDAICTFVGLLELMKRRLLTMVQGEGVNRFEVTRLAPVETIESIRQDDTFLLHMLEEEPEPEEEPIPEPAYPLPEEMAEEGAAPKPGVPVTESRGRTPDSQAPDPASDGDPTSASDPSSEGGSAAGVPPPPRSRRARIRFRL